MIALSLYIAGVSIWASGCIGAVLAGKGYCPEHAALQRRMARLALAAPIWPLFAVYGLGSLVCIAFDPDGP